MKQLVVKIIMNTLHSSSLILKRISVILKVKWLINNLIKKKKNKKLLMVTQTLVHHQIIKLMQTYN